jgi:nitrite reductase/ring-hydroxylating ferredoxin subunit/uncharacterized membrane protein
MVDSLADRLERLEALDPVAEQLAKLAGRIPPGPLKDALSGTWLGHPLHPSLVVVPIGNWLSASLLDLFGGRAGRRAARRLVGAGVLAALPTAAAGLSDWGDTVGAERRVGVAHLLANDLALSLYTASWLARRRGRQARGVGLALLGAAAVGVGGYLGGHLAYALGVGVDTTAFAAGPETWTEVAAETDLIDGVPQPVTAGGLPVLLIRTEGRIVALADRCTHRGAPLHEGRLVDGWVECPWHGSRFRLTDGPVGSVARGPATRPQPAYEVRVRAGTVEIRAAGPAGLRTNAAALD